MSRSPSAPSRPWSPVFWGLLLIAAGVWFLLDALGFSVPGMGSMWPIFPTLIGAGLFAVWLFTPDKRSAYGIAIPATINLLVGLFFFGFTLGILPWGAMGTLWPVFPLIVGLAFVVAWVFSFFRVWGLLIPGLINCAVGIIGLALTTAGLSREYLGWIWRFWPVLLILVGLIVLVSTLARGGTQRTVRREPPEAPPIDQPEDGAYLENYGDDRGAQETGVPQDYKRKPE